MSALDILRTAFAKLDGGRAWCKGAPARDANSDRCLPEAPEAVRWDCGGAVYAVDSSWSASALEADALLRLGVPGGWLNGWQDHPDRTWAEIDGLFRAAIELAESRAA